MTCISTVEAREKFSEVVNRAAFGQERIVLTRRGKALAAVVPIEDLKWMEELEDRLDIEEARAALKEDREQGGRVSLEQLAAELGL
ncbi:MAG TPA: type II toxin-antitoxin system Phd/YefM family antitoxin [Thermomicrobiales bacterium]